jgi:hypothetical protein
MDSLFAGQIGLESDCSRNGKSIPHQGKDYNSEQRRISGKFRVLIKPPCPHQDFYTA